MLALGIESGIFEVSGRYYELVRVRVRVRVSPNPNIFEVSGRYYDGCFVSAYDGAHISLYLPISPYISLLRLRVRRRALQPEP